MSDTGAGSDGVSGPSDPSDLSDLDPEFLASLEGLPFAAREGLIAFEREAQAFLQARQEAADARQGDDEEDWLEGLTRRRLRELFFAQQMLEFALERRDAAVLAGRTVGYSWAELADIVGVSRQGLRQRFASAGRPAPDHSGGAPGQRVSP